MFSTPFDSRLEADFAEKMGEKCGQGQLLHECEIILLVDTMIMPDFALVDTEDAIAVF